MKRLAGPVLALLVLPSTSTTLADTTSDSSATRPAMADTSTVAPPSPSSSSAEADSSGPITVTLRNGTQRRYQRVESWPNEFVRALRSDGKYDYIPKHEIAKITGEITEDVLGREVAVGKDPEEKSDAIGSSLLRGRPLPDRKAFPLLQAGLLTRLNDPPNGAESSLNAWFDAGGMVNLSPKFALGGTVGVASDFDYSRIAVKARLRRWLEGGLAIDVAPGFFIPQQGTLFDSSPDLKREGAGFVGELAFVAADWFSISYVLEIIEVNRTTYIPGTGIPLSVVTETDLGHQFGVKAGGGIGLLGVGAMLVGLYAASD